MAYTLLIGNKTTRRGPCVPGCCCMPGIAFAEEKHLFETPEFAAEISSRKRSPNGRVPVLVDGDVKVWDSLAIAEYLAERHPGLWP